MKTVTRIEEFEKQDIINTRKSLFLVALVLLCMGVSYYSHFVLRTDILVTHIFYIPIILAGFWWGKRAILVAAFLGGWLLSLHFFLNSSLPGNPDFFRSVIFVIISFLVSKLGNQGLKDKHSLHETSNYLINIINHTSSAVIALNPDLTIAITNNGFERLTSYTAADIVGQEFDVFFPDENREEARELTNRALDGEHLESAEIPIRCKDGELRTVLWNSVNIYDVDNATLATIIMIGTDITDLKQEQEKGAQVSGRMRLILESTDEGIYGVDENGRCILFNSAASKMLGYSPEEMLGNDIHALVHHTHEDGTTYHKHDCPVFRTIRDGQGLRLDNEIMWRKDGASFPVEHSSYPIIEDGIVKGAVVTFIDITERKEAKNVLLQTNERLKQIYRVIPSAIFTVDMDGIVASFNKTAEDITGYAAEEVIGKKCTTFALEPCSSGCGLFKSDFNEPIIGKICSIRRKDGEIRTISKNVDLLREIDGAVTGGVESFEDITERKRSEEKIKYMAYYDALTDLPNRALLNDRLSLALSNAHRNKHALAVLFLDLDNFKTINDSLGHAVGDQLLLEVAERLKKCTREGDTLARLGGDEFILLLPNVYQAEDAVKVAKKVLDAVNPQYTFDKQDLHVTTSIGIALYPDDGIDAQTLLKNADTALYRAKEQGRNNYQLYKSVMNANAFERLDLENRIRKAF